jgi:hypothetical protein
VRPGQDLVRLFQSGYDTLTGPTSVIPAPKRMAAAPTEAVNQRIIAVSKANHDWSRRFSCLEVGRTVLGGSRLERRNGLGTRIYLWGDEV